MDHLNIVDIIIMVFGMRGLLFSSVLDCILNHELL